MNAREVGSLKTVKIRFYDFNPFATDDTYNRICINFSTVYNDKLVVVVAKGLKNYISDWIDLKVSIQDKKMSVKVGCLPYAFGEKSFSPFGKET